MSRTARRVLSSSAVRGVAPVVVGFAMGWGGVTALERGGYLGPVFELWTATQTLRLQHAVAANALVPLGLAPAASAPHAVGSRSGGEGGGAAAADVPAASPWVQRYLLAHRSSVAELRELLEAAEAQLAQLREDQARGITGDALSAVQRDNSGVPFARLLRECGVSEQCDWLLDHATEDIPFFYIGDLFHSWVANHYEAAAAEFERGVAAGTTTADGGSSSSSSEERAEDEVGKAAARRLVQLRENCAGRVFGPPLSLAAYENEELTLAVWRRAVQGVLPFDVGVQALALLATSNRKNAAALQRKARAVIKDVDVRTAAPSTTPGEGGEEGEGGVERVHRRREVFELNSEAAEALTDGGQFVVGFSQGLLELARRHDEEQQMKQKDVPSHEGRDRERRLVHAATAQLIATAATCSASSSWWRGLLGPLAPGRSRPATPRVLAQALSTSWNDRPGALAPGLEATLCGPTRADLAAVAQQHKGEALEGGGGSSSSSSAPHSAAFVPPATAEALRAQLDAVCAELLGTKCPARG